MTGHAPLAAEPPPPVVAVFNHKGGVAKTTTACNLATCLAALGYQVVLADLDAQGNATGAFGLLPLPPVGAYDLLTGRVALEAALAPTPFPGLTLLPATTSLRTAEWELAATQERSRHALRDALRDQRIGSHADIVIIDCPPSLGTITANALMAAAAVLIPARADPFSHEGLINTWHEIKRLRQDHNAGLAVAGILLTMTDDADDTGSDVARSMRAEFGDQVYPVAVPADTKVVEAAQLGIPVVVLEPDGGAGLAYVQACAELAVRLCRQARSDTRALAEPLAVGIAQNTLREWRARLPALQRLAGRSADWTAVEAANPPDDSAAPPAQLHDAPARPRRWPSLLAGLAIGLVIGFAAARLF